VNAAFDVVVIGAGSVGVPTALYLSREKLKVLVLDQHPSPGQGQNKSAIGGVRATHSDAAKILLGEESIRIFSRWEEETGDGIAWKQGGYCFPVYREEEEVTLKDILPFQKKYGLHTGWVDADTMREIVPGIKREGLRGGIYSPEDGQVSPVLFMHSLYKRARGEGCVFQCNEKVTGISVEGGRAVRVRTDKGSYDTGAVVNAAGAYAKEVGEMTGLDLAVFPESHEAGISSPVEDFLEPMVVDMRPGGDGKTDNFYFTQAAEGPIIFCYTPKPPVPGTDRESTSEFLPVLASRLISLLPRCKNLLIRRTWRGLYPMTPDGYPICGGVREIEGMYLAAGMCGQGFMLGPGLGKNMASLITAGKPLIPEDVFATIGYYRNFEGADKEALT
jgi:sarcosine oxidase, subunit beta